MTRREWLAKQYADEKNYYESELKIAEESYLAGMEYAYSKAIATIKDMSFPSAPEVAKAIRDIDKASVDSRGRLEMVK